MPIARRIYGGPARSGDPINAENVDTIVVCFGGFHNNGKLIDFSDELKLELIAQDPVSPREGEMWMVAP